MGLARKLQTFICFNVKQQHDQEERRKAEVPAVKKRTPARALVKSLLRLCKKPQEHLLTAETILQPSQERDSVMAEELRGSSPSSSSCSIVELKKEQEQASSEDPRGSSSSEAEEDEETAKREALLASLQCRMQDIIQRLMNSYGKDDDHRETVLLGQTLSRGIGGGPNSWERRVQSAIDRLSRIHNMRTY